MIPRNLDDICELFGCVVLDEHDYDRGQIFWLGEYGDVPAGIYSYELTPDFDSLWELEEFCESDEGIQYINEQAALQWFDWDEVNQEWKE